MLSIPHIDVQVAGGYANVTFWPFTNSNISQSRIIIPKKRKERERGKLQIFYFIKINKSKIAKIRNLKRLLGPKR